MAGVWDDSLQVGGGADEAGHEDEPKRGHRKAWVIASAVVVVVLAGGAYAGIRIQEGVLQSLTKSINDGIGQSLQRALREMRSAGTAANAAANVWTLQPSVNVAGLNAALPQYQWVDGATNVPSSSKPPTVGIMSTGTHIETAIQTSSAFCSYGLAITSSADPLISQDHLSGMGTYYQSVYDPLQCAADQAPTSGWVSWPDGVPWASGSSSTPVMEVLSCTATSTNPRVDDRT